MKLWVNLAVAGLCCNQKSSNYVLKPTGSTSFEFVYYNCGASQLQIKKKEVLN